VLLFAAVAFPAQLLSSQANGGKATQSAVPPKRPAKAAPPAAPQPEPEVAEVPPAPVWPANKQPQRAQIVWDSHGLKIEASNSSLDQILKELSTVTGAKIEGFSRDQRIFGTYGPGPAREVLSRLLDGSGYNVLMVGGVGDAPPHRVILSTAGPAGSQPQPSAQNQQGDNDIDVEPDNPQLPEPENVPQQPPPAQETPQPTPIRNPFGMPMPPPGIPQPQPMPPDQQQPNQQNQPNAQPQ
jgi:hypothetical protein